MGSHTEKLVQPRDQNAGQGWRAALAKKNSFVIPLCANSEGTPINSLKSCTQCESSLSLHLLQAPLPSSNLVQTLLRPQRKMWTPDLASLAPPLASHPLLNRPRQASPRAAAVVAKAVPSPKAAVARPRPAEFPAEASLPAASASAAAFPSTSSAATRLAETSTMTMTSLAAA